MIRSVQAGCKACPPPACTFPYKRLFPVLFKLKTCGNSFSFKKTTEKFAYFRKKAYFCIAFETKERAFSSAGSEHLPYKQRVGGSNPSTPTIVTQSLSFINTGRLAQLVQSICLTSRGSAVRIRQRPHPHKIPFKGIFFCTILESA